MTLSLVAGGAALLALTAIGVVVFTMRTVRWGATREERGATMPGDAYFTGGPRPRLRMTRAVTIDARPDVVWPWLAQLGRGAGWYSYDVLDNGRRASAQHIVGWIPPPAEGDAAPIGYLRHIEPGVGLTWWLPGTRFLGSLARLTMDMRVSADGPRSRLVIRMTCDGTGGLPRVMLALIAFLDSVMARRQLLGLRDRVERYGARTANPDAPETGARDQYQLYEVIYASGGRAGVRGKERAEDARRHAEDAGVIGPP